MADHFYYVQNPGPEEFQSPELKEENFSLNLPYGVLEYKQWCFEGIRIKHTKTDFNGHYLFENKNTLDAVGLEFNLNGNYEIHHLNKVYQVNSRQHNIIYSPHVDNTFFNKGLKGETFVIHFLPEIFLRIVQESNDTLKRFAEAISKGQPAVIANVSPLLTPELSKPIQEIIHCRFTGGLKKVFLLSKCMEILVLQAEAFDKACSPAKTSTVKNNELDPIYFARDYILKNYDNPPNLSELSKIAGINEYKLKKRFKEVYNVTVFEYLSDFRLETSRKALLQKNKTISEIAYELGYSSPQHFSMAFKKKFGIPPKDLQK